MSIYGGFNSYIRSEFVFLWNHWYFRFEFVAYGAINISDLSLLFVYSISNLNLFSYGAIDISDLSLSAIESFEISDLILFDYGATCFSDLSVFS